MKRFSLLLLVLFLTISLSAQTGKNLDFEAGASVSAHFPFGWKTGRLTTPLVLVDAPGRDGRALLIQSPFTKQESGMVYQMMPANGKPYTKYKVTARVRMETPDTATAYVYAYGKNEKVSYIGYIKTPPLTDNNDWQEVSMEYFTDNRVDSIRLGCFLEGTGKAWFDDITFEEIKPKGTMSKEAKVYLKDFFQKVSSLAIDRETIDWKALKKTARANCPDAQKPADLHPTMQYVLQRVNKHSFMFTPEQVEAFNGGGQKNNDVIPDIIYAKGRRINEQVAYLSMPGFGSGHAPTLRAWADSIRAIIARYDNEETTGWVLDLRGNGGGNCWPMLAGVGPLLGEGVCGYFMDRNGDNPSAWSYRKGSSFQDDRVQTSVTDTTYTMKAQNFKVAVLTGPKTASSGEVTTIAFREKANARSFGQPTAGYSTTNTNVMMSDNAMLLLTVSIYGDRNKNPFGGKVVPDVVIEESGEGDAVLEAAVKWLQD